MQLTKQHWLAVAVCMAVACLLIWAYWRYMTLDGRMHYACSGHGGTDVSEVQVDEFGTKYGQVDCRDNTSVLITQY